MSRRPTTRGFTLIELLVVVAIIALLISILLPALGAAKSVAQTSVCLGQKRSIGMAMTYYMADFNRYTPALQNRSISAADEYAREASGLSGADWAAADLNGRGWAVPLWPYYQELALFRCPSDPHKDFTSDQRGSPETNFEAYIGAPRQSYFLNQAVVRGGDSGNWHTDWSQAQLNELQMFDHPHGVSRWSMPTPYDRVVSVHRGGPAEFVWMMDVVQRSDSANWGGFYGAFGGGRRDQTMTGWERTFGSPTSQITEYHPTPADGPISGWDNDTGGANYLFMDGHADNRMTFPTQREMACHNSGG